ncbi:MAG: TonB-dependent receptor [Acidobacteriota bacterium]|nr:TonB-dependent receptor [Acidobacteriota bacterium]
MKLSILPTATAGSIAAFFCSLFLLCPVPAAAQVDTGTILGTVTDASGRLVPAASVEIKNQDTGFTLSTQSGAEGTYIFTPLHAGTYSVAVSMSGFSKETKTGIKLDVQQSAVVDFSLVPGQVASSVEVSAAAPLLQTQDASVGQVFNAREIEELPLNGRNYTLLAQLTAGTTTPVPETRGLTASGSFVANGVPSLYNTYILDGITNNNNTVDFLNGAAYVVRPPVDAIQEFKVQTTNYSAEFARAAGAVVNAVVKSGTNSVHGDLWEFIRNDALDGTDFFLNAAGKNKGEFRRNQFGFTLGGPIVIPHLYNGKNKTFIFGAYEGTRIRQSVPFTDSVPTANERNSGFTNFNDLIAAQTGSQTDLLGRSFPLGTIFDPATTRVAAAGTVDPATGVAATANGFVRDPFPGNIIPASRVDPVAVKLLNLFPLPNQPGILNNEVTNPKKSINNDTVDIRLDHNFSQKDQMFIRASLGSEPQVLPSPLGGLVEGAATFAEGTQTNDVMNYAWSETHIFSPSTINEFRLGYSHVNTIRVQPFGNTGGLNAQFGVQGIPDNPPNGGLTQINISGLNQIGSHNNLPLNEVNGSLQLHDNLTKQLGAHSLRMGVEYQRVKVGVFSAQFPHGYFAYSGQYTTIPNGNAASTGIAQFVLAPSVSASPNGIDNVGGANQVQISPLGQEDYRRPYYGSFIQDNWTITRKLSINLGLRWEYYPLPTDHYGADGNFLPGTPFVNAEYIIDSRRQNTPLSPSFLSALQQNGIQLIYTKNRQLGTVSKKDFAPRIGVAYQLLPKLVIRAGYGIFFNGIFNVGDGANVGNNYPFAFGLNYTPANAVFPLTADNSIGTLENGLLHVPLISSRVNASGLKLNAVQYNFQTPYIEGINFTTQYQISPNQSLSIGYVGSLGRHLATTPGTNLPSEIIPPNADITPYLPFPAFPRNLSYSTTDGNSFYYSVQTKYERRFSKGLSFLAAYTWGRVRDDVSDTLFSTLGYRASNLPGFGIQGDYGRANFDIRNTTHLSGGYELPFGKNKRYLNKSGWTNAVAGGWRVNGLATMQGGSPVTIGCTVGTSTGMGCDALLVPGQGLYTGAHTVAHWLNAAAFSNPAPATTVGQTDFSPLGGAPTQASGPRFHRGDLTLAKQWHTTETTRVEFRAEVYNLTNTPNFGNPGSLNFGTAKTFASITTTRDSPDDPREFQFALKFYF